MLLEYFLGDWGWGAVTTLLNGGGGVQLALGAHRRSGCVWLHVGFPGLCVSLSVSVYVF